MAFRKAQRTNAKLRLALTGTAGSGKTYSAILIAKGLGGKIAMIDTENGSGDLYSDLCEYDIAQLKDNFHPKNYASLIYEAQDAGYDTIIIDSISPEWSGKGGILDIHSDLTKSKYRGNGFNAWNEVTPLHNRFIQILLESSCHIIATMRCKTDYVQQSDGGRTTIQKAGLAPIQRDGMDYEFGTVFDISPEHLAVVSKDRTQLFGDTPFLIDEHTGEMLRDWLNAGTDAQKGGEA